MLKLLSFTEYIMSIKQAFNAVGKKDLKTFEKLINSGVSINATNENGESFLTDYLNWGYRDYSFIFYLLTNGIDVNSVDKYGQSALMHGIMDGNTTMMIDLLEFYDNYSNADECIKFDINRQDNWGKTALMFAAIYRLKGYEERTKKLIRVLFKHGAVNDLKDDEDKTAADYAQSLGVKSIIKNNGSSVIGRLFN